MTELDANGVYDEITKGCQGLIGLFNWLEYFIYNWVELAKLVNETW